MNIEALIARKMAARGTAGLHVRLTFQNREPFNYYARDEAKRDAYLNNVLPFVGKEFEGDVLLSVKVV